MIYPRVNMLKKGELRYQGTVSSKFIFLCMVGIPIVLVLLVSGLICSYHASIKSQLKSSQALWENLEPRLNAHKKGARGLVINQNIQGLFKGWEDSCISFISLLSEVQDVVPETVQLRRLSIRSDQTRSRYKTAADLQLDYQLNLEGIALGSQAEKAVISFQKDLLAAETMGATFDSLKLASLRKRIDSKGETITEFRLTGGAIDGGRK